MSDKKASLYSWSPDILAWIKSHSNNIRFSCLVESKPVTLKTTCSVMFPLTYVECFLDHYYVLYGGEKPSFFCRDNRKKLCRYYTGTICFCREMAKLLCPLTANHWSANETFYGVLSNVNATNLYCFIVNRLKQILTN